MKKMGKVLALCLALAMMLSLNTINAVAAESGSKDDPKIVEESATMPGYYLMNDEGDIWYKMVADQNGIFCLAINGDASYEIDVIVNEEERVTGNSDAGFIIVGSVSEGDTVLVHNSAGVNIVGNYYEGTETDPVYLSNGAETVVACVAPGETMYLKDGSNSLAFCGTDLWVTGDYVGETVVDVDGEVYTGADEIEATLGGDYEKRPLIAVTNNADVVSVLTLSVDGTVSIPDTDASRPVPPSTPEVEEHNLEHVPALEADCLKPGNVEYWYCADCDGYWTDEECTQAADAESVILPAKEHENLEHVAAVEPGCDSEGNVEYWSCPDCEGYWTDEECTQATDAKSVILPAKHLNLTHVAAVEPTIEKEGNIAYWHCADCDGYWTDEECTQATDAKSVILPVLEAPEEDDKPETDAPEVDDKPETDAPETDAPETDAPETDAPEVDDKPETDNKVESSTSNENYYVDSTIVTEESEEYNNAVTVLKDVVADKSFAVLEINLFSVDNDEQIREVGEFIFVTMAVPADVVVNEGQILVVYRINDDGSYIKCDTEVDGDTLTFRTNHFSTYVVVAEDEDKVEEHKHVLEHYPAVAAGCHSLGNIEYWYCTDCGNYYADEACTIMTNSLSVILPAAGSENVKHVAAVEPTSTKDGNMEYWYCPDCETYYADENCTIVTNVKRVILPATGTAPKTGDNTNIALWVSILGLGAVAVAGSVVMKKRAN